MDIDYARLFARLPLPALVLDDKLKFGAVNGAYCALVRKERGELIGRSIFELFPQIAENPVIEEKLRQCLAGESNGFTRQFYRVPDEEGKLRDAYWTASQEPLSDGQGNICGLLQIIEEVTEQVERENHNAWISRELDHRVKNLLAIVSSIGRRTARSSNTIDDFLEKFDSRLSAMAITHEQLAQEEWRGMRLSDLMREALEPFIIEENQFIKLNGDEVFLQPRDAQTLSLGVHELVTNAARYGAIADPQAELEIKWRYRPGARGDYPCRIEWIERLKNSPEDAADAGFGSEVIDILMPRALNGEVERKLTGRGLQCTIAFDPARHAR